MEIEIDKVRFRVSDAAQVRLEELVEARIAEGSRGDLLGRIEVQYKEARDDFRYYGLLRAQIAWLPAVITFAAFNIVLDLPDTARPPLLVLVMTGALFLVLLLVWLVQLSFQRRQKLANVVSSELSKAHEALFGASPGAAPVPAGNSSTALRHIRTLRRDRAVRARVGWWPDAASWGLLVFFVVIFAVQCFVATQFVAVPQACAEADGWDRLVCIVRQP